MKYNALLKCLRLESIKKRYYIIAFNSLVITDTKTYVAIVTLHGR